MANRRRGRRLALALLLVSITACAGINARQFVGPNGKTAYAMRCSGFGRTLEDCYEKAGQVCPGGYLIIDRASSVVGIPTGGGIIVAPQQNLAIECK